MFKITVPSGVSVLTEMPNWVRVHPNDPNCFVPCRREDADGVAYKNNPTLFRDGTVVEEIDGGDVYASFERSYMSIDDMAAAIREGVNEV